MKTIPPIASLAAALLDSGNVMVIGDGCSTRSRDLWMLTDIIGRHLEPKKEPACERCKGTGEVRPDGYAWCCPDCGGTGKANNKLGNERA